MLALNSANTYGGGTTIHSGTLSLGPSGTIGSGGLIINPGGVWDVSAYGAAGYNFTSGVLTAGRTAAQGIDINGNLNVTRRHPRAARPQQHHDHQRQPVADLRHDQLLFRRQDRASRRRRLESGRRRLRQPAVADRHRHLHALHGQQRARQPGQLSDHDRRHQQPANLQPQRLRRHGRDSHRLRRAGQPALVRRQQQHVGYRRVAKLVQPFHQRGRLLLRRRQRDFQRHARQRHERQHQRHGPAGQRDGQQYYRQLHLRRRRFHRRRYFAGQEWPWLADDQHRQQLHRGHFR